MTPLQAQKSRCRACEVPRQRLLALLGGLILVVGASGLVSGCQRSAQTEVRKVLVDVDPGAEGPGLELSRASLRPEVDRALDRHRAFSVVDEAQDDAALLRVRLESLHFIPHDHALVAQLALSLELTTLRAGKEEHYSARAEVHGDAGTPAEALPALARLGLARALDDLAAAFAARDQASDVLLSWLDDSALAADRKAQALRLLAARREVRVLPALIRFLEGDDPALAQAALGAIAQLGDAGAVDALIAYAENQPPALRLQVIDVVRVLGSARGMAWLFTHSTGHPDATVRSRAARALEQLEAPETAAMASDGDVSVR